MTQKDADITALLRHSRIDEDARAAVYELVYSDLRRLAGHRIASSRPGETLSVTALVNDAYIKLTESTGQEWNDRNHFLSVAAKAMRQITIDYVRSKLTNKRGSGIRPCPLESIQISAEEKSEMVVALEEGLQELTKEDARLVAVVECRFYAGLTIAETAAALGMSTRTVERNWERAREWLREYLT